MKVTVFAQIQARSGQGKALSHVLKQLVKATLTEVGCLEYTLHQSIEDADQFWMYEVWQSQAALDAHMASPHFNDFVTSSNAIMDKASINKAYAC
ncbi:antibiotic biosynthesis monooxygenase [Shewanella sp. BC20]|uniref:putative quinol monooxygenase n=1 Tax=Shewanella sp. BC20 TaxID=2004459 RepID=UPI000D657F95|nr:putative quinol monooxygenase [Shewanella sp. BC20]PWF63123.1 antibiotic biosynthesis monooxygenase [Shewanella sp. BC20]